MAQLVREIVFLKIGSRTESATPRVRVFRNKKKVEQSLRVMLHYTMTSSNFYNKKKSNLFTRYARCACEQVIHYDAYLELRRLAGAEGALEIEAHRRRRVVVGRRES